jgi:DNA adenine methylase
LYDVVARLQGVQIEQRPALEVIERFDHPDCLHFIDPPYVADTRGDRWAKTAYAVEMDDGGHRDLAEVLHGVQGAVVLAGYHSRLYDELYADWARVEHTARQQSRETATEVLWLSPKAAQAQRQSALPLELVG